MIRWIALLVFIGVCATTRAQIAVDSVTSGKEVMQVLAGKTFQVLDVQYYGSPDAIGRFKNMSPNLQIRDGIYIGTGSFRGPLGPNNRGNSTTMQHKRSMDLNTDPDLEKISSNKMFDIAILQFTFIPQCDTVCFRYVFGSEEYPEYVNKKFNDVFGFFISGPGIEGSRNMALLPDSTPISINSVNMLYHPEYFIKNYKLTPGELAQSIQFDGLTTKLTARSVVIPGKRYQIKIAIADVNDGMFDSGVFLEANSFTCVGKEEETAPPLKKDSVVKTINLQIEFAFNSTVIPERYFPQLNEVVEFMKQNPSYISDVNGHTDDVGSAEYNQILSEKRAKAVVAYLVHKGIDAARLNAAGLGNTQPLNRNASEKEKARNRRVEFIIKK